MGVNVTIEKEDKAALRAYAKKRGASMSETLKHGLVLLQHLDPNPEQTRLFQRVFDGLVYPPSHMMSRGFLNVMVSLSENYPQESSKTFWGPDVYLDFQDRTHYELVAEIYARLTKETTQAVPEETLQEETKSEGEVS